jgi:sulfatase maturation enzyme AslB (radical SAM superfamily)
MKEWNCAAITNGVAIFPNGKIGPCCLVDTDYLKPIDELSNPNRFSDLNTGYATPACKKCVQAEHDGIFSYRQMFNNLDSGKPHFQFVDIRNTNLCNLKCRYCGPHFSSQWAEELGSKYPIKKQSLNDYRHLLTSHSLQWMYFTGGEPMISSDHWELLEDVIASEYASNISLLYNTNLTTVKYKDIDIVDIWKNFKSVTVNCSIDAVGKPLEYIRSGADWEKIHINLTKLLQARKNSNINVVLTPVLNILNIWFIADLFEYAKQHDISVNPTVLSGPDYLSLDVIPDQLKDQALFHLESIKKDIPIAMFRYISGLIQNNINNCLFNQTINHTLLLDNNRKEKLFDLLPFKEIAKDQILKNYEYEQR